MTTETAEFDQDAYFAAWHADQKARRAARLAEIRAALEAGRNLVETMAGGVVRTWPACSPFLAEYNTPEYLSRHLESREYGFGFILEIA